MPRKKPEWNADTVRALRLHMELTQTELAEILGVRQQTVSEWETAAYEPRGASATLLGRVADDAGYEYNATFRPDAVAVAGLSPNAAGKPPTKPREQPREKPASKPRAKPSPTKRRGGA